MVPTASAALERRVRQRRAGGLIGLVLALVAALLFSATPAGAATASGPVPGDPGAAGPSITTFDPAAVGYTRSEFFLSGTATAYAPAPLTTLGSDGQWSVVPSGVTAPFTTRLTIMRPSDPRKFDGTVIVEWLNVTNQSDSGPDWLAAHNEIIREGHAWVGVTAQAIGVNAAKALAPARYASLTHPGDSFSYDIFTQAGDAVRDDRTILGGSKSKKLIAAGESQSAGRMVTYIDAIHPLEHTYDGYLVHSRNIAGSALSQAPQAAIPAPSPTLIRSDLDVPVFTVQAEDDVPKYFAARQPDTKKLRTWEMAGTSHADQYTLGVGQPDTGNGAAADQMFARMLNPTNDPLPGILPPCPSPVNAGPHHWLLQAAVHHLVAWVERGTAPPKAPRIQYDGTAYALDANGNVLGGVRSPQVDAPVATLRGPGNEGGTGFCRLFGVTTPFSEAKLDTLYRSHPQFVLKWTKANLDAVKNGYLLLPDAVELFLAGARSTVGS